MSLRSFYKDKRVLITGNTGFKGSWLTEVLLNFDATVTGYALEPNTSPSLYKLLNQEKKIKQYYADIRDFEKLNSVFEEFKPEIVFHLAAQPLVLESYKNPRETYEINVIGTVNVLECVRLSKSVITVVNVTTDKVYRNNEWISGYRESDVLDGYDPYSNSKSCSELVTATYNRSFFKDKKIPISTMRAGNVLGGGDFSENRIVPDCIRSLETKEILEIRNPNSIRPYQHVLEPLLAYLKIAKEQVSDFELASSYNIGPEEKNCVKTKQIVDLFNEHLKKISINPINVNFGKVVAQQHEANLLMLDCSKFHKTFSWTPKWDIDKTIEKVVEFVDFQLKNADLHVVVSKQINEYLGEINE